MLNYANLSQRTLSSAGKGANSKINGRSLLPIKLGITDECQHVNHEIKVMNTGVRTLMTSRRETFHQWIDNCQSLANLFLGLAKTCSSGNFNQIIVQCVNVIDERRLTDAES